MQRNSIVLYLFMIHLTFAISLCVADETLVGYWKFDEGSGSSAKDLSEFGNDGVIKGEAIWKPGKDGMALEFSKDNKNYVEVLDNETLDISARITMCAWIKPYKIYTGDDWKNRNCIMAKLRAYYLDITEEGYPAFYLYNVQPQQWLVGNTDMRKFLNTWVHVAAVYDGKEQMIYVNGKLDVSESKSGTITVNNDNFAIGWVDYNRYFDGLIDEAMLWSRELTEKEIQGALAVRSGGKLADRWGYLKSAP